MSKPVALFLDVGANRGHSIKSIRLLKLGILVIAFEPNPNLEKLLEKKCGVNQYCESQVSGLGEKTGSFYLFDEAAIESKLMQYLRSFNLASIAL